MEHPLQSFLKYASLSTLGMAAISCYILADTFFVAQGLGTNGLAALNLAMPAYNFIHGTGLMLGMGGATKYSVYKSRNETSRGDVMFTNTLYLGIGFSLLFLLLGLLGSEFLIALFGANRTIFDMSNTYLKVLLLFSPAFILNDILLCFVRNDGNPRLSMLATVGGSLSNIVLDYVFIFPCGMGIFGAVFATGLAPVIGILIMLPHWLKKSRGFHLVKTKCRAQPVKSCLSLGFPSLLVQISSGIVTIVLNAIILRLMGNTGIAAYGVIANISLVVVAVYTGIAQGMQPLISQAYGQQRFKRIQKLLRYGVVSTVVLSCLIYACLFLFAGPIVHLFNSENNPELQKTAIVGLKIYFTSVFFVGYNIVLSTYFTSIERALPAQIITFLKGLLLIIPMSFLLSSLWGMTGVWLSFPVTELLVAVLGLLLYAFSKKEIPKRR